MNGIGEIVWWEELAPAGRERVLCGGLVSFDRVTAAIVTEGRIVFVGVERLYCDREFRDLAFPAEENQDA